VDSRFVDDDGTGRLAKMTPRRNVLKYEVNLEFSNRI
jgi:hypothetical protein